MENHKDVFMVIKSVLSSLEFIQEHRNAFLLGTIIPALFGLFLGETVISVMFHTLQPISAGMTLIIVETLGAILVDFPLSVVAGFIIAKKIGTPKSKHGVLTGAIFLTVFYYSSMHGLFTQFNNLF
jgi:CBS domain containing-hemolysin-like protein